MPKFLDKNGLQIFWSKIKSYVDGKPSVTSFNGRGGAVTPQNGDYTADLVGAVPTSRTINNKPLSENVTLNVNDIGAAPTNHASNETKYGIGTTSNYGHVKLSDAINENSTVSNGVAATPKAVKDAYDLSQKALATAEAAQKYAEDILKALFGGTLPNATLESNSPEVIQRAAYLGLGENFWSVGDSVPIALNGTVGALALSGTYYAFILGFNHNPGAEGGNGIDFQFGKNASGVNLAFVDDSYNTTGSTDAFRMNKTNANAGGWENSYMRTTLCKAFFDAIPDEWQKIIAPCTKYSDNTGGGKDDASYVTATEDKIWLLSEFEVHGSRSYANSAEKNYQKQYEFFKNANDKKRYKHNNTGSACLWWLRSVYATNTTYFCSVRTGGGASYDSAYGSIGFAPGFKVA